ncbi:hypothetical protein GQ43DRAFT_442593 [Delitschia confertaspora ATCC 74209]|uniref:Myb-like domain-containing protein n=1 Tax=Delitschia confertaspora ATCC 74209 TaxID=1513339 RepID=A0A9P4JMR5_9PLEO|nr:hypothetical protein GQ43DRAFT_442593 [Delitschia confertaspora ATCC 74209]
MPKANKRGEIAEGAESADKTFKWSAENDHKLLILALNRINIGPKDYNEFVTAMPGSTYNGVRFRIAKFRTEQMKLYEELGWAMPAAKSATPVPSPIKKKNGAPEKRDASEMMEGPEDKEGAILGKKEEGNDGAADENGTAKTRPRKIAKVKKEVAEGK